MSQTQLAQASEEPERPTVIGPFRSCRSQRCCANVPKLACYDRLTSGMASNTYLDAGEAGIEKAFVIETGAGDCW